MLKEKIENLEKVNDYFEIFNNTLEFFLNKVLTKKELDYDYIIFKSEYFKIMIKLSNMLKNIFLRYDKINEEPKMEFKIIDQEVFKKEFEEVIENLFYFLALLMLKLKTYNKRMIYNKKVLVKIKKLKDCENYNFHSEQYSEYKKIFIHNVLIDLIDILTDIVKKIKNNALLTLTEKEIDFDLTEKILYFLNYYFNNIDNMFKFLKKFKKE